jgi:hypothetical protein
LYRWGDRNIKLSGVLATSSQWESIFRDTSSPPGLHDYQSMLLGLSQDAPCPDSDCALAFAIGQESLVGNIRCLTLGYYTDFASRLEFAELGFRLVQWEHGPCRKLGRSAMEAGSTYQSPRRRRDGENRPVNLQQTPGPHPMSAGQVTWLPGYVGIGWFGLKQAKPGLRGIMMMCCQAA